MQCPGFLGARAQAQQVWCLGPAAPWHVGSSGIRDGTCVPCIGRQILIHCATREATTIFFNGHGSSGSAAGVGHDGKGLFLFYNFCFFIGEDLMGWVTCQLVAGITQRLFSSHVQGNSVAGLRRTVDHRTCTWLGLLTESIQKGRSYNASYKLALGSHTDALVAIFGKFSSSYRTNRAWCVWVNSKFTLNGAYYSLDNFIFLLFQELYSTEGHSFDSLIDSLLDWRVHGLLNQQGLVHLVSFCLYSLYRFKREILL